MTTQVCQLCGKEAAYDSPVDGRSWAYLCESCFLIHGSPAVATKLFKKKNVKPKVCGKVTPVINYRTDECRYKCPHCGHRNLCEMDADSSFCNQCSNRVELNPII